jgi:hypothetical protein
MHPARQHYHAVVPKHRRRLQEPPALGEVVVGPIGIVLIVGTAIYFAFVGGFNAYRDAGIGDAFIQVPMMGFFGYGLATIVYMVAMSRARYWVIATALVVAIVAMFSPS